MWPLQAQKQKAERVVSIYTTYRDIWRHDDFAALDYIMIGRKPIAAFANNSGSISDRGHI